MFLYLKKKFFFIANSRFLMVLDGKDLANNKCEHLGLKLQKMNFRDENDNWHKLIGCLDFSLQYLYSRDEIEVGILWNIIN